MPVALTSLKPSSRESLAGGSEPHVPVKAIVAFLYKQMISSQIYYSFRQVSKKIDYHIFVITSKKNNNDNN